MQVEMKKVPACVKFTLRMIRRFVDPSARIVPVLGGDYSVRYEHHAGKRAVYNRRGERGRMVPSLVYVKSVDTMSQKACAEFHRDMKEAKRHG